MTDNLAIKDESTTKKCVARFIQPHALWSPSLIPVCVLLAAHFSAMRFSPLMLWLHASLVVCHIKEKYLTDHYNTHCAVFPIIYPDCGGQDIFSPPQFHNEPKTKITLLIITANIANVVYCIFASPKHLLSVPDLFRCSYNLCC